MPQRAAFDFETAKSRFLATAFACAEDEFETALPELLTQVEFARRVVAVLLSPAGEELNRQYAHLLDEDEGFKPVILAAAELAGPEVLAFYNDSDETDPWDRFDFFFEGAWDVAEWLQAGREAGRRGCTKPPLGIRFSYPGTDSSRGPVVAFPFR